MLMLSTLPAVVDGATTSAGLETSERSSRSLERDLAEELRKVQLACTVGTRRLSEQEG